MKKRAADLIGKFTSEYDVQGSKLYLRGLTVGEYMDLCMKELITTPLKPRTLLEIALVGIEGWSNIIDEDGDELVFDEDKIDLLPESVLNDVGKFIYNKLTILDKKQKEKLKAYTHFTYWADENEKRAETYDCKTCLKRQLARSRPGCKFTDGVKERLMAELNNKDLDDVDIDKQAKKIKKAKSKYKRKRRATPGKMKNKKKRKARHPVMEGYKFEECPIALIDDWIWQIGNILYHAEKSNIPLTSSGIMDQPYKLYSAARQISGVSNKIERDRMEEERDN